MKNKLSILTIVAIIFLSVCTGYTFYNYKYLSENEGWGVVFMAGHQNEHYYNFIYLLSGLNMGIIICPNSQTHIQ